MVKIKGYRREDFKKKEGKGNGCTKKGIKIEKSIMEERKSIECVFRKRDEEEEENTKNKDALI